MRFLLCSAGMTYRRVDVHETIPLWPVHAINVAMQTQEGAVLSHKGCDLKENEYLFKIKCVLRFSATFFMTHFSF